MKKLLFTLGAVNLALFSPFTVAEQPQTQQAVAQQSAVSEIEDNVVGVTYEVDENGQFTRIRATAEADLEFGDRKDIRTATQKATLRAKSHIAKFLSERITSEEVLDEVENVVSKTENNNGNEDKKVSREAISSRLEKIHNSAETILKGVIATKTDINKDEKYVQVEVRVSLKTMAAANTLNKALRTDSSEQNRSSIDNGIPIESNGGGREIKKVKNYDNI